MKKLAIVFALGLAVLTSQTSDAQINVNVNIGAQPLWGPVGYDRVDYYYIPAVESYYSVPNRQFIYLDNNKWQFSNSLPARYQGYDLYNGYKVVVNSPKPYLNFKNDKIKYAKYKTVKSQPVIRYSKNPKYKAVIHANGNGIPPGQAKKIVPGTHQKIVVGGSKGSGKGKNK